MPLELEAYRDNIERLDNRFPNCEVLLVEEVVRFTGRSRKYLKSHYGLGRGGISKVLLAKALSKLPKQ